MTLSRFLLPVVILTTLLAAKCGPDKKPDPMPMPPPPEEIQGLDCPYSNARFSSLEEDDEYAAKIDEWKRLTDGDNDFKAIQNIEGFYISKNDLLKILCSQCEDGDTTGIVVKFGVEGDGTKEHPRKLMPYVSGAKMNVHLGTLQPYDLRFYADFGVPDKRWR